MNLPAPWFPPAAENTARFQRLARQMVREARKWAKRLARHALVDRHSTGQKVFRETLAFAAFLLTEHSRKTVLQLTDADRRELATSLRTEFEQALTDLAGAPADDANDTTDALESRLTLYAADGGASPEITPEGFARFCQVTGMHSTALVGAGPNLAHIFFYLRLFAVIDANEQLTLEQRKHLLRAAQDCRDHFAALTADALPEAQRSPALPSASAAAGLDSDSPNRPALAPPTSIRS